MKIIKIYSTNREQFAKNLKKINLNEEIKFELTDALALNFEILMYYFQKKQKKELIILKGKNIDILCYEKLKKLMATYYIITSKFLNIKFEKFSHKELYELFGQRNYILYCRNVNIEPQWYKLNYKLEKAKIKKYKKLKKYKTYKILLKRFKEIPFSSFNFPTEAGQDRFVFYFHIFSDESKNKMFKLFDELGVKIKEIRDLINTNTYDETFYYAIGFSYKDGKLIRISFYSMFSEIIIAFGAIKPFLEKKHNLEIKNNLQNVWYYAIDYFKDHKEIKIYEEPYYFNQELENLELNLLFKNKPSTKATKYRDGKIIDEKYEFHVAKNFSKYEKEILAKHNMYKEKTKVLSMYLDNGKIRNYVLYEI